MDPYQYFGIGSLAIKRSLFLNGQRDWNNVGPNHFRETIAIPKWANFMYAHLISGGSGGQGGFSAAAGTARGGGGSSGTPAGLSGIIPTALLPEHVDLLIGHGSLGGTSGVNAVAAGITAIQWPQTYNNNSFNIIQSASSLVGTLASAAAGGGAGATGTVVFSRTVIGIADGNSTNGVAGGAQTGAAGATAGSSTGQVSSGGGGGGIGVANTPFGGGAVNNTFGAIAGGTGDGGNGNDGYMPDPRFTGDLFVRTGGSGGASGTLQGGRGGNGGWGCSGGGGGAGVTGGQGGSGGPGFAWLIFF